LADAVRMERPMNNSDNNISQCYFMKDIVNAYTKANPNPK